jgi:amino acid transporter
LTQIKAGPAAQPHDPHSTRERIMPITDVVILSMIIVAFLAFGAVLAWGDRQTHEIAKASRARALAGVGSPPTVPEAKPEVAVRKAEEKKPARTPVHA